MKTLIGMFLVLAFAVGGNSQTVKSKAKKQKKPVTQIITGKSSGGSQTDGESVVLSSVPLEKSTKNQEAEKFRNSGIEFSMKLQHDSAIADFTKAIELDLKYADAYSRRGAAYSNKQDNKRAIADFTKAIELNPTFYVAYLNRATSYLILEDYQLAITDFNKLIELDPQVTVMYDFRADAYDKIGKRHLAAADRQKIKQLRAKPKQ